MSIRKIINGKVYDTATATKVFEVPSTWDRDDFAWEDTALYRTAKGAFFLAGSGNAASRWAKVVGHDRSSGSGLRLIDELEARILVEEHGTEKDFEACFGKPEEG